MAAWIQISNDKKRNISHNFNFTYFSFGHPLMMAINATFVKRSLKSICSSSCGNRGILGHDAHIISERERKHFYQQKKQSIIYEIVCPYLYLSI